MRSGEMLSFKVLRLEKHISTFLPLPGGSWYSFLGHISWHLLPLSFVYCVAYLLAPSRNAFPNVLNITFPSVAFLIFPDPSSSSDHLMQAVTPLVFSAVSSFLRARKTCYKETWE